VPIVVAVNKIDVPDADPNRVRSELSTEGLQPEEWGGTTQFSDVSARESQNLDDLLEKVLLVADAELELTANPTAEAPARSSSRVSTSVEGRPRRCSSTAGHCTLVMRSSRRRLGEGACSLRLPRRQGEGGAPG